MTSLRALIETNDGDVVKPVHLFFVLSSSQINITCDMTYPSLMSHT